MLVTYENQISFDKHPLTSKGYWLGVRIFKHSLWLEAYSLVPVSNMSQPILISRLTFAGASFNEVMNGAKCWAQAYGSEFTCQTGDAVKKYFTELKEFTSDSIIESVLTNFGGNDDPGFGKVN